LIAYIATAVYVTNFVCRGQGQNPLAPGFLALSLSGTLLISITGYLGGISVA
jgi:uncharacterized membrane protein